MSRALLALSVLCGVSVTAPAAPPLSASQPAQIQLDVVLAEVPPHKWITYDVCPACYADRFGRDCAAPLPIWTVKQTGCPLGALVPGWLKRPITTLWLGPPGPDASQEHLDGILDRGQHKVCLEAFETLVSEGRMRIHRRPCLLTQSGLPCRDEDLPITAKGFGSVGVQFDDLWYRLEFLPNALAGGRIRLDSKIEILGIDEATGASQVTQRKQRTVVLEAGQSLVQGGYRWILLVTPTLVAREGTEVIKIGKQTSSVDDRPAADLTALHAAVRSLVLKHYPRAEVTLKEELLEFRFNTRTFTVHEPTLDGRWQDAWQVPGPQKGGIFGVVKLIPGKYAGQACRPSGDDKRYFNELRLAPHSARGGCYLDVLLRHPRDASEEFLTEFRRLADGFEKHVTPPSK